MQKKKSGVKNVWKFVLFKGGGGGRTPNGKYHLKFPFWLFEPLPCPHFWKMNVKTLISISFSFRHKLKINRFWHNIFICILSIKPTKKIQPQTLWCITNKVFRLITYRKFNVFLYKLLASDLVEKVKSIKNFHQNQ